MLSISPLIQSMITTDESELRNRIKTGPYTSPGESVQVFAVDCVSEYLQFSQVGKVFKSFSVDGRQLVVAKISGKRKSDVNFKKSSSNPFTPTANRGQFHMKISAAQQHFS